MSLKRLLDNPSIPDRGEKRFRCGTCGKTIRLSFIHDDYVCKNCATKWRIFKGSKKAVFKDELLNKGTLLTGWTTEPYSKGRQKRKVIDRDEVGDKYIRL